MKKIIIKHLNNKKISLSYQNAYISVNMYDDSSSLKAIFRNSNTNMSMQSGQVDNYKRLVLDFCLTLKSTKEIKKYLGINSRNYVREKVVKPLIEDELLDYVNKNHINASNQKYITIKKSN